ncbi:MAG: type I methionyl aminopeptidase [Parcubacteria group bacterium GW2011_GWA2_38_13b]|nr:MAG: type I methionyl aminopeptidase [Parcubacteria group bacterium GW2011_GWA2_38_13b]
MDGVIIKSKEEINVMREGGRILAAVLNELSEAVKPGIKTLDLEFLAEKLILKYGVKAAFKDYSPSGSRKYPNILCVSVNEEIVHAIPSERILAEGDIVSLDCGIWYKELCLDAAITVPVGQILPETARLVRVTKKALKRALKKIRPGNTTGDIGNTIERYVQSQGFGVIRDLVGHGVGKKVHEEPAIPNYGKRHGGVVLQSGMTIAIEPMVSMGDYRTAGCDDGWGVRTADKSLSAHFEHTVAITEDGYDVLTA